MTDEKNKRRLYDALSQDYDMGSFEQFSNDVEDEVKRRKLYDAIKEEYDFLDFDGFSRQLVGEPKPKPAAQQQVQPYNGDFTMRESELEKGNSQQPTKPAKTQPAKPKAAPITTPNIPSIQQMMDNRPQFKPVMQSEVGLDANGNRVRKPKVTKEPIGNTPQTAPVYRDFMGNEYDATSPDVQKEVERQTHVQPLDVKQVNREQVADLSKSIDDMLAAAQRRNIEENQSLKTLKDKDATLMQKVGAAMSLGMPGSSPMAGANPSSFGTMSGLVESKDVQELKTARRSMRDAQRIIDEADHNAQSGTFSKWLESSFAGGAARGFGQKLFDVETWDMGTTDAIDAMNMMDALKAFDEGKTLTESQQAMLDAKAVELATNAYFGSYVGRGYKAGQVTAESIPFMLEMCLNPASGTGHSAQNMMARYAIKRFGKAVVKNNAKKYIGAKIATRVSGDIVGAGVMAGTTGMVGVAADAQNRMNGDVRFDINDEGKSVFVGHENGKDFGTAFKEAFAARTIENYSEMFGEYFSPLIGAAGKGIGKGLSKFGLDNVNKFVENVAASDIARLVSDFERRSKWNGTIGEYAEEVVGGVMNALIVGDQTLDTNKDTGVFNLDNNIDTFLGVSLFGGAISSVKTLGYRTPKYTARHNMTEADNTAAQIFGNQDTWGDIRNTIAVGDDADVKAKLKEVLSNPDVSAEQKLATLQYAKTVQEYKGVLAGETKRRAEQAPVQTDLETSYDNGYMLEGQEMNDAKNMLDFQRQRIGEIAADDMLQQLDEEPVSALDFIRTNEDWSDEEKQTAIDYVNAKATYEGMLQRVADDVDGRIAESDRLISERTSKTDGMIHPAVLKAENKQVYIVDGNVMMMPDGSMVDSDNSDESIIVRDAETGEISFVSPADILMVEEALDAEEERQTAQEAIRQQFAQQAADEIDGVLRFNPGEQYTVLDDEGQEHTIEVVPNADADAPGAVAEGNVLVSVDGAYVPQVMPMEEVQRMADAYNAARLAEYEKEKEAQRAEEVALATPQTEQGGSGGEASPEQTGANEPSAATVEPMPMIGEGEDAEPDFLATTPERAHSYLYNEAGLSRDEANQFVEANKKAADKELEKAKKGKPQMGTSLAKYKKEQSEYQQKVDAAQQVADYWQAVKDAQQRVLSAELDARAAEDAANIAQAKQEELLRQEEELRKQAAQAALGTNNVAPAIREKWDAAPKVEGARNEIVLANGERVPGKYVLVESGAATPSHNPRAEFAKNEGFPVDKNGQSVNDRDYEGDKDAQTITRQIASNYDQRALQSPVVVTNDGVVLSGNGRTMAGELAARDNTDGAYIGYLLEHPELFGFTKEQVESMAHPRVLFVPDEAMPYTADTFAKFNQQEMKGQSKTEQAVKLGKLVDDATFGRVIRSMNAYDTLGDFYADIATSTKAINELRDAGAISQAQYAEMFDGDAVSARGREMLEAMLIGKAFESNPNALRQLTEIKSLRQSVLSALAEISNNIQLGEDYSLESELSQAIDLAYQARKSGYSKAGDKVSGFARQGNLFQFDEGATVADCENVTVLLLADILNDNRSTRLKNWLAVYNKEAKDSAQGQMDLFTGDVKARKTIIDEVNILLNNGTEEEIKQQLEEAAEQRKAEAEQSLSEDGTGSESNEGDNVSGISGEGNKTFLDELKKFYDEYESGENGLITDGDFIEGARDLMYQHLDAESELYKRLMSAFEDYDDTHNAYLYENGMRDDDGSEAMIEVLRGVVAETETEPAGETAGTAAESDISPLREQYDKLKGLHPDATILFRTGDTYTFVADDANEAADILGITLETDSNGTQFAFIPSADLDKTLPMLVRAGKRVALADGIDYANPIQVAEQETDTNPTEAQKKAGNYKKGHVKIDGYDVTIENPKGSVLRGTDAGGKKWEQTMHNTYGYIRGTEGVDGDHIDVFLSDNPEEGDVYVIDQVNKDGSFDEHKVMYGFNSAEEASAAYLSNYEEGWQGLGAITGVTKEEFKKWVESSHRKTKPFADYKSVKATQGAVPKSEKKEGENAEANASETVAGGEAGIEKQAQEFVDAYKKWGEDVHNDASYKAYKDAQNRLHEQMIAMSDDELAAFNEKYGKQYGAIADEVRKEQGRRLNEARINKSFEDGLQAQGEITGTAKAPKVATDSFTSKDETRQVLNGVYYDESGYAVATDGSVLVADKSQYDEGNKGKIVASHKAGSYKKGDVIPGNYPKWRMVVDGMEGSNTASVAWDGMRNFLAGAEEQLKARWKAEKESNGTKESFASWSEPAIVAVRMPNGEICVYNYGMLRSFADAAASMGMSEITYGAEKPLKATNDKGIVMLMPVNPTAIAEEEFGHENEGRRLYYEWGGAEKAQEKPAATSKPAADAAGTVAKPAEETAATTAEGTTAGKPAATRTRASKVGKIDDFGEKIGGARKDVARGRIRDTKKMTVKDLTTLKKGADDILSQANIMRLYKDGQMDEQTARGFMALNNAAKVAMKHASPTGREIIMTKYRDAAVAWEEGKPFVFEVTDEDVKAYQSQFGVQVTDEKARESLDYLITDPYNMFMQTYEAIDYPAVERKLGQYVIVDYTSMKGRHWTPSRPYWVKNGLRAQRGYPFGTMESAVAELKKLCPEVTEKEKKARGEKAEHGLHVTKEGYGFYIKSRNIPGNIYLSPKFWTEKEAKKYLDDNLERLKEREQRLVDALMGSNIGMAEREGVDYRNGKDVTPQDFLDEFGFRGVEFGNWVPQGERQMYLNKTYDAIKDFCAIVGISPRAFSLGGRLGLAFGARGKSRAMAHYEPGKEVINLTRMSGVGSLAHEWFHALDNYLAKQKTGNMSDMATETHDVVREELGDVFKEMFKAMRALDYDKRSRRAGEYWGRTVEEFARLFENYIYNKLAAKETTSPVLVREDVLLDNIGDDLKNSWPYPSAEENAKMEPYFDKLFDTIQEKTDANGNVVLFQKVDGSTIAREADAAEEALRDEVIRLMREAGIEVSTDWEEGQRVLDEVNGAARLMGGGEMSERRKEREEQNRAIDTAVSLVTGRDIKDVRRERIEDEEQRRRQAKEIYDIILSGEYNDVSLQKISDYINDVTPNNPYGRRLSERLPQRVERKVVREDGLTAVDTLFSRASESSVAPNERVAASGRRAVEERKKKALEQWAKATGNWHTDLNDFTDGQRLISDDTSDSDVYLSKDGQHVIKLSRGKQGKRFAPDIDNIPLFNYVFPSSAYKILGYGDFGKGFVRILEQPYVDFETSEPLTEQERVEFMDRLGFKPINKSNTAFGNGEIIVADLQKNNVVKDGDGNIHVIDADCKLHTKDVGGNYTYFPVEHDLPKGIREMRAYHGSGADFDAFDHSHMGEGEGAQAYGWGTYVTEVEGIGRTYARSMARKPIGSRPVLYKGEDYQKANQDGWSDAKKEVFNDITDQMRSHGRDSSTAIDNVRGTINLEIQFNEKGVERSNISEKKWNDAIAFLNGMTDEQFKQFVNSGEWIGLGEDLRGLKYAINDNRDLGRGGILLVCEEEVDVSKRNKELYANRKAYNEKKLEALKEFDEGDFTRVDYEPILYTVDIPEDNGSNYLDYDASMEQQAGLLDAIGKGLEKLGWKRNGMTWSNETHRVGYKLAPYKKGRNIYEALSNMLGSDKAASEFLHDVGIVGMKYPTEFRSGGRSDGSKNYVIFDENDAKITDKIKFFRTSNGEAYGFTLNGKIYLDPRIATSETPIHEYAHLWAQALRQANPEAWEKLKEEMRNEQDVMDYVKRLYPEITDEDELLEEVFTHYSGKRGAERLRNDMREEMAKANGILDKARVATIFAKLRDMLSRFWNMARDLFAGRNEKLASMKGEDFADMMMNDLMSGFKPDADASGTVAGARYQFVGEQGATEADRAEGVVTRIESLATAKQMEADGRPALNIKMATGWERGKDGKWRYETEDDINAADKGIDAVLKEARKEVEELDKKADNLLARINRLDASIPKRITDRFSEEEKAKYTKMREERDQLIKEWSKANRAFRAQEDENRIDGIKTTLGEILGDDYELFKYYPDMKDMSVTLTERLDANGEYEDATIKLKIQYGMASTLLHEIQHAIQHQEGFAKGGNMSSVIDDMEVRQAFIEDLQRDFRDVEDKLSIVQDAKASDEAVTSFAEARGMSEEDARAYLNSEEARLKLHRARYNHLFDMLNDDVTSKEKAFEYYKRIAGEVEARNVQERAYMSADERRRSLAEETEDILRGEQIVTYGDAGSSASIVEDEDEVARLEAEPKVKRYRAMAMIDGKLYPPMSVFVDGQLREPTEIGTWERSDETPFDFTEEQLAAMSALDNGSKKGDIVIIPGKLRYHKGSNNGKGVLQFRLKKDNGDDIWAAYNPYFHTSTSGLNDQFTSAYNRPNLVVVEVEIPESELTSGYKAENAKDKVGDTPWKSGTVNNALPADRQRTVTLSRWAKVTRVVPDAEVADLVSKQLDGTGIEIPFNVVTPSLRDELVKRGVKIGEPQKGNAGAAARGAYEEWKNGSSTERLYRQPMFRDGEWQMSYDESLAASKAAGYTKKQHDAWWNRMQKNMRKTAEDWAEKMHIGDIVTIVDKADDLDGMGFENLTDEDRQSKGWFDPKTGKIVVILGNHGSAYDVLKTMLHEGVSHYGLRQLFGKNFDTFLDNAYAYATPEIRAEITRLARDNGWNFHTATEEYLGSLAEDTNFEKPEVHRWWETIRRLFWDMLHKIGLRVFGREAREGDINDNELRYILWRSYKNLTEPGSYRNLFNVAEDVAKQYELGVGKYAKPDADAAGAVAAEANPEGDASGTAATDQQRMEYAKNAIKKYKNTIGLFKGSDGFYYSTDPNTLQKVSKVTSFAPRALDDVLAELIRSGKRVAVIDDIPNVAERRLHRAGQKALARDTYERLVASGSEQFTEAVQDSMRSLRNLYKAITGAEGDKKHIRDVAGYENAYLAENRMHSASQAQIAAWEHDFIHPIVEEVYDLVGDDAEAYDALIDYMMAKHGLERNRVLAERDAKAEAAAGNGDYNDLLSQFREKDYAGLTALTGESDVSAAEATAQQMVDDYEASHYTAELWKKVNAATKSSLEKLFRSGMMSKERYEKIRDMFEYYIPLQGFDETVAEDVYAYMGSDGTRLYGTPIRTAKGRKSKADDPLATIQMNGEAAIRQGNRNEMKQTFLNFVQNHPSDLVSVSDVWLRYNDITDEWEQYFDAGLRDGDTAADVARKVESFEKRMEQLAQSDPDHYKRGRDLKDVPFRVLTSRDMAQHQVIVRRGGKTYVLTINGNPRAAQALNGMTNPDVFTEGIFGKAMNFGQQANRLLSSLYTTRNPEFVASNYVRDALYSNSMTWVKESPSYALKFHKNFGKCNPKTMGKLFVAWENGELRKAVENGSADEMQRQFYDFMMNGGETGWTSLRDIEQHKKALEADIRREGSTSKKAWKAIGGAFDIANRAVENSARFAAFLTSREMGRSLERSIYDAKEVSVNFNKKGSGDKFLSSQGQTRLGKIGATLGGLGRGLFVFFNAGVQGMSNIAGATKEHPYNAAGLMTALYMLGAVMPVIGEIVSGDGDDDDDYYNLPEYVRRSNIVFRFGKDKPWVKIPLPIEFRAMYGLGELACGVLRGKERYNDEELAKQFISQISQVLPLDFMEGGGGWHAFVPSLIKPGVEAYANKSWIGLPIYRDNKFKPYAPQWTLAYDNTDKTIVSMTRWLNEATGGSDVSQGWIDWNPARIEYMLKGYFGGYYTMYDRLKKTAETAFGERDFEWRNIPVASRFLHEGDERTSARKAKSEYFDLLKEYDETKSHLNGFKKIAESKREDAFEYAKRIDFLYNSKEYTHYQIMDYYKPFLDEYYKMEKNADGEEKRQIQEEEDALRREFIDLIHAVDDKKDVNVDEHIYNMIGRMLGSSFESISKKADNVDKKYEENAPILQKVDSIQKGMK